MDFERVLIVAPDPRIYSALIEIGLQHGRQCLFSSCGTRILLDSVGTMHPRVESHGDCGARLITDINDAIAALTAPMEPPEPPFTLFGHEVNFGQYGDVAVGCHGLSRSWLEAAEREWNRQPEREAVYVETPCKELYQAVRLMLGRLNFSGNEHLRELWLEYIGFDANGCTGGASECLYYVESGRRRITLEELPAYLESKPVAKPWSQTIECNLFAIYPGDRIVWACQTETAEKVNEFLKRWHSARAKK